MPLPRPLRFTPTQAVVTGIAAGTFALLVLAIATGVSTMSPSLLLTLTLCLGASVVLASSPGARRRETCRRS